MTDKDYLKRVSLEALKVLSEALLIAEDEGQLGETGKALSLTIDDIISEKEKVQNDVLEMDFSEYRKYLKRKEEDRLFDNKLEAETQKINVWEFLLNIKEYIQASTTIERQGMMGYWETAKQLTLTMDNGDRYVLIINTYTLKTPITAGAFSLNRTTKNNTKYTGTISFKMLQENNPLDLKPEDAQTFAQYIDDICNTKRV